MHRQPESGQAFPALPAWRKHFVRKAILENRWDLRSGQNRLRIGSMDGRGRGAGSLSPLILLLADHPTGERKRGAEFDPKDRKRQRQAFASVARGGVLP